MRYAELHCKSNFSFLEGASHADELVSTAAQLGYAALAITDRNSLAGIVRAYKPALEHGLKLIIGAELVLQDAPPLVVWATDRPAYGRLARLITLGRRRAEKGDCLLYLADVAAHADGLLAGMLFSEQCGANTADSSIIPTAIQAYRDIFGDRLSLLAELNYGVRDQALVQRLLAWERKTQVPLVAAGDVHYHIPNRMMLHDVLTAIRHGTSVDQAFDYRFANSQRHLKSLDTISSIYAGLEDAVERSAEIADRCSFTLDELKYEYPEELAPAGMTAMQHLTQLTWDGADVRYPQGVPEKVRQLLQHELTLIAELRYEAYFLTVWDLVRFARSRNILCQGRGSAANSAVCYCLGVTAVDPHRADLLFERFVSKERDEAPDIDVDFEHERREEVLQYLYQKYGRERAGLAAVVITYRVRSAVRDAGKALGLSLDRIDALSKQLEGYSHEPKLAQRCEQAGIDPNSRIGKRLLYVVNQLIGFPRHLSQHVGGMVITQGPLCELVPIENAAMQDRTVICWDKNDLDDLGILKVDCLSLGMLTAIRKCFDMVKQHYGQACSLASIPEGDKAVYDMICDADTMGVFQIESRAQMSMLPRLRPRCYYDLVIEVAIVRPGPIQGQMVHPYLRRRMGHEQVRFPNAEIERVLKKTLGVPIFQEQAMRLAVVAAGFTPGEADQLRRAMGAWRRQGVIEQFQRKLTEGMLANGLSQEFAEQVFRQIRGFGEYGFPESHAASFALLVYVSAWLKHYFPAAFAASLINSQPMGFYAPSQLIRNAQEHGVQVRPIDVNCSQWDCSLERLDDGERTDVGESSVRQDVPACALRLGFRLIRGLQMEHAEKIMAARSDGPFGSLHDFSRRTGLSRKVVMQLSEADAFGSVGCRRRTALWEAMSQETSGKEMPLFDGLAADADDVIALPQMPALDEVFADYDTTGLSLKSHPLAFYRERLNELRITPHEKLETLRDKQFVRVAGLVILRQRPGTAKGITFVTLEDETAVANLVIRQEIWDRYYNVARRSPAWVAHGTLESRYSVIHIVVHRLEDLAERLNAAQRPVAIKSRDFR